MTVREILQIGNPILRKRSYKITHFDDALANLTDDMVETMHAKHGVGLAAPQIGVSRRLIVVQMPDDEDYPHAGELFVLCNPEIAKASHDVEMDQEGCLSVVGYVGHVERAIWVVVHGQDLHGRKMQVKAHDFLARAFQHEIDHLNGVLYVDVAEADSVVTLEEFERRSREEQEQEGQVGEQTEDVVTI
jgi:peptide deformylase